MATEHTLLLPLHLLPFFFLLSLFEHTVLLCGSGGQCACVCVCFTSLPGLFQPIGEQTAMWSSTLASCPLLSVITMAPASISSSISLSLSFLFFRVISPHSVGFFQWRDSLSQCLELVAAHLMFLWGQCEEDRDSHACYRLKFVTISQTAGTLGCDLALLPSSLYGLAQVKPFRKHEQMNKDLLLFTSLTVIADKEHKYLQI